MNPKEIKKPLDPLCLHLISFVPGFNSSLLCQFTLSSCTLGVFAVNLIVISASQSYSSIVPMRRGVAFLIVSSPRFDILLVLCAPDSPSDLANLRGLEACQGPRVSVSVQPGRSISTQIYEHSLLRV